MGVMWPRSGSYEFDNNGDRAPGALAYFFTAGTSTPLTVYQDADEGAAHEHPVEADGNGRWPAVFIPFGSYKVVLTTSGGTTLFTIDDVPNPAPVDLETTVDENAIFQTGDYLFVGKNGSRTGFVRCNGTGIGSATSGATQRANADCEDLFLYLWNNYANGQCAVSTGRGASAAADWAANKTISLPDHRGATIFGFDDMGSTDSNQSDSAPVETGSGIIAGSILGANTHALTEAQLAQHDHAITAQATGAGSAHTHGTGTFATVGNGAHTHTGTVTVTSGSITASFQYDNTQSNAIAGGGLDTTNVQVNVDTETVAISDTRTWGFSSTSDPGTHTHTFTGSLATESAHTHSLTGITDNVGSGTAHNTMQRGVPVTVLMKL
jgi:hypothetical protein